MPCAPASSQIIAAATGSGSSLLRASRRVAMWSMLTAKRMNVRLTESAQRHQRDEAHRDQHEAAVDRKDGRRLRRGHPSAAAVDAAQRHAEVREKKKKQKEPEQPDVPGVPEADQLVDGEDDERKRVVVHGEV